MTKYVIRRVVQAIPVLFGITIVVYSILLAAPGGPTAKFAQNPRMTIEQQRGVQKGLGPRSAHPGPVLPVARRLQPGVTRRSPTSCRRRRRSSARRAGRTSCRPPSAVPRTACSTATSATRSTGEPVSKMIAGRPCRPSSSPGSRSWSGSRSRSSWASMSAVNRYSLFDQAMTFFSYVCFALPTFWLGLMLIFHLRGPGLNVFPAGGMIETRISPPFGTDAYWPYVGGQPGRRRSSTSAGTCPAGHHAGRGEHRRRLAVRPRVHARVAQPGLRPDGQGQGPAAVGRSSASTPCATRCCRS